MQKRPIYTIENSEGKFTLHLYSEDSFLILKSKPFDSFKLCEKFLDTLRVHLCFQTNFSRSKNLAGQYGFDIRTCWDDLVASSTWFADRNEREAIMKLAFDANKNAVFVHTSIYKEVQDLDLQEVA